MEAVDDSADANGGAALDKRGYRVSFVAQGFDGVELRGLARRIEAEEHADARTEHERDDNGTDRDERRPMRHRGENLRRADADQNSDDSAQRTERDRLD